MNILNYIVTAIVIVAATEVTPESKGIRSRGMYMPDSPYGSLRGETQQKEKAKPKKTYKGVRAKHDDVHNLDVTTAKQLLNVYIELEAACAKLNGLQRSAAADSCLAGLDAAIRQTEHCVENARLNTSWNADAFSETADVLEQTIAAATRVIAALDTVRAAFPAQDARVQGMQRRLVNLAKSK